MSGVYSTLDCSHLSGPDFFPGSSHTVATPLRMQHSVSRSSTAGQPTVVIDFLTASTVAAHFYKLYKPIWSHVRHQDRRLDDSRRGSGFDQLERLQQLPVLVVLHQYLL
jgi:hypothetical protein